MARVKMNAKHEYEFIANYKVLQNIFKAKKIEKVRKYSSITLWLRFDDFPICKPIQVEKLVKCKMQYVSPLRCACTFSPPPLHVETISSSCNGSRSSGTRIMEGNLTTQSVDGVTPLQTRQPLSQPSAGGRVMPPVLASTQAERDREDAHLSVVREPGVRSPTNNSRLSGVSSQK